MVNIQDKCVFIVKQDQIVFVTQSNGDKVNCKRIHIPKDDSAALAYMINSGNDLKITIKEA